MKPHMTIFQVWGWSGSTETTARYTFVGNSQMNPEIVFLGKTFIAKSTGVEIQALVTFGNDVLFPGVTTVSTISPCGDKRC